MKVKLNVGDRFILSGILPEKGNFETLSIIEKLKSIVYPSEEELKELDIRQEEDKITWNKKGIADKEFEITDSQHSFLLNLFSKLSEKEELVYNQYLVYKKLKTNG